MSDAAPPPPKPPHKPQPSAAELKLAAALRANLARRKQQLRGRTEHPTQPDRDQKD